MTPADFAPGTHIRRNGQLLITRGCGPNGLVIVANPKAGTTQYLPLQRLSDEALRGRIELLPREDCGALELARDVARPIPADLSSYDEKTQAASLRRLEYVRLIKKNSLVAYGPISLNPLIDEVALKIKDTDKPNWRTVIRWIHKYDQGQVTALITVRSGNSHSRLDDAVEDLIYLAIKQHYMQSHRPSLKMTHLHLEGRIGQENKGRSVDLQLIVPSYVTLRRRVAEFDGFELMCARMGRQYAVNHFRTRGMGPRATRPLEVVQMDHTVFDAEVTYKGIFRLGKPKLTIARDQFTGAIVGLHVGFAPVSYQAVMECMLSMVLDKKQLSRTSKGLKHAWNMFGIPETLVVDNGLEFQGLDVRNACQHLGIDLVYCPPRKPWFKPHVERLFGVIRQKFVGRLKGRTYTVREDRGDQTIDDEPLIDLEDFETLLHKWVIDIHNETPYGATSLPPRVAWEQSIDEFPPRADKSDEEVRIYCGRTARRSLQPYGIEIVGLYFASNELSDLRRHIERSRHHVSSEGPDLSKKLLIKYDPRDLGCIWVLDPIANVYIAAKAVDENYAKGLSLHRHRMNTRLAKHKAKKYVDAVALVEASDEIDQMIADMTITDAERLRSALAQALNAPTTNGANKDFDIDHEKDESISDGQSASDPAESAAPVPDAPPPVNTDPTPIDAVPESAFEVDISGAAEDWLSNLEV